MANNTSDTLNQILADYQVLYQKLRTYHWNVTGRHFFGLHAKFEELYNDVNEKVDEVAERIRALGGKPLGTLSAQASAARLKEDDGSPDGIRMVQNVVADLEAINGFLRDAVAKAEEANDRATANLLDGFADGQEKTLWMLKAFLATS